MFKSVEPDDEDTVEFVVKARQGNRSDNLMDIASCLDTRMDELEGGGDIPPREAHEIRGLAEQLRIIAKEIKPFYTGG